MKQDELKKEYEEYFKDIDRYWLDGEVSTIKLPLKERGFKAIYGKGYFQV